MLDPQVNPHKGPNVFPLSHGEGHFGQVPQNFDRLVERLHNCPAVRAAQYEENRDFDILVIHIAMTK